MIIAAVGGAAAALILLGILVWGLVTQPDEERAWEALSRGIIAASVCIVLGAGGQVFFGESEPDVVVCR